MPIDGLGAHMCLVMPIDGLGAHMCYNPFCTDKRLQMILILMSASWPCLNCQIDWREASNISASALSEVTPCSSFRASMISELVKYFLLIGVNILLILIKSVHILYTTSTKTARSKKMTKYAGLKGNSHNSIRVTGFFDTAQEVRNSGASFDFIAPFSNWKEHIQWSINKEGNYSLHQVEDGCVANAA